MVRLKNYYGPKEYEQKIIRMIRAGNAPGNYTKKDIIEGSKKKGGGDSMGPSGMRPRLMGSMR